MLTQRAIDLKIREHFESGDSRNIADLMSTLAKALWVDSLFYREAAFALKVNIKDLPSTSADKPGYIMPGLRNPDAQVIVELDRTISSKVHYSGDRLRSLELDPARPGLGVCDILLQDHYAAVERALARPLQHFGDDPLYAIIEMEEPTYYCAVQGLGLDVFCWVECGVFIEYPESNPVTG